MAYQQGNESYMHRAAKSVLKVWAEEYMDNPRRDPDGFLGVFGLDRDGFVREEICVHPGYLKGRFYDSEDLGYLKDRFYDSQALGDYWEEDWHWPLTFDMVVKQGKKPLCVLDLALGSQGGVHFAIEVCHTSPVSDAKAQILNQLDTLTVEVSAEWVLRQVRRPTALPRGSRMFGIDTSTQKD
jgi:hypothetical protein